MIGDEDGSNTPASERADPVAKRGDDSGQKDEAVSEQQSSKTDSAVEHQDVKPEDPTTMTATPEQPPELSMEVRTKLRKLERMETKYAELLRAYRTAHARVQMIEPFEASLRENTPLTSINDPSALIEYLNQVKVKGDMVLEELKRVSTDREEIRKKLTQAEGENDTLKVEAEELRNKMESMSKAAANPSDEAKPGSATEEATSSGVEGRIDSDNDSAVKSPASASSRIGSFSLFSPKFGGKKEPTKDTSEDLFSYDSELPRMEQELQERTEEVSELKKQVDSLKGDLAVARESTSSMVQTLEVSTYELNTLRDEKEKFEVSRTEFEKRIQELMDRTDSGSTQTDDLRKQVSELEIQKQETATEVQNLNAKITVLEDERSKLARELESRNAAYNVINEKLSQKDEIVKDLEDSLAMARAAERDHVKQTESEKVVAKKLSTTQGVLDTVRNQLAASVETVNELRSEIKGKQEEFDNRASSKVFGFLNGQQDPKLDKLESQDDVVTYLSERFGLRKESTEDSMATTTPGTTAVSSTAADATGSGKKKNKKKKKGGKGQQTNPEEEADTPVKVSEDLNEVADEQSATKESPSVSVSALELEITTLKKELDEKNNTIDRLSKQIKDQELLTEEIETLRDDLLHQGEEHVEARDALKVAQEKRKNLESMVEKLEQELQSVRKQAVVNANFEKSYKELSERFEELKTKSETTQKDLSAAESLATARFKDISDLKDVLSKAQPELRQLRLEVAELKAVRDNLKNKEGELKRMESRHEDLKSEMKGLSKRLGDQDSEIKELQTKIDQESKARNRVENELSSAQLDARVAENKRKDTSELLDQRQKDLARSKEEATNLRKKIRELDDAASNNGREIARLSEEVTLKTALHSSSQSLLQSLRDQTHELSIQAREASSRADSLEEELTETQRMLSERTKESETMRMLLDKAQTEVEARIREMRERMERAVEERDRIEDEANVRDRRLMREVDDARNKMRDAQRQLKTFENERDELETKNREWRRRGEELEQQSQEAKKDVDEVRQAMKGIRDALDESERQIREGETQKAELRRQNEDVNERLERLTKANNNLSEETKKLQEGALRRGSVRPAGVVDNGPQSSRTSVESARSPAPPLIRGASTNRSETPTGVAAAGNNVGLSQGTVDYVYLKNVLLQFMEQKDKAHQRQLVPVLAMLLHFDR